MAQIYLTTLCEVNGLEVKSRKGPGVGGKGGIPKYGVWTPDGRELEEFRTLRGAMAWARAQNGHADTVKAALVEALRDAHGQLSAVLTLCQEHDPKTGFYKAVTPYQVLEAMKSHRLTKINAALALAEKGGAK